jgi:hypothetical protein
MKKLWRVAAFAAALVVADATSAATFFGGSWALKASNKSDPGLIMVTDKAFGSFSKSLDVGQSFEISVLKLWTNEREVNGDDKVKKPFSVAFNFSNLSTSGTAIGDTYGVSLFGAAQAGKLTWRKPLQLSFGPGGTGKLTVALTDRTFNAGFAGLDEGKGGAATLKARITYNAEPSGALSSSLLAATTPTMAPVPLPAAGLLLLGALGSLGFFARRRA